MTNAYTEALLISAKREKETASGNTSQASSSNTYRAPPRSPKYTQRNGSPRSTTGPVDEERFNVRDWEKAHYGLKSRTAEERQAEYIRNLRTQMRGRAAGGAGFQSAGFQSAGRTARTGAQQAAASGGGSSTTVIFATLAACASVWTAVYKTNVGSWRRG